MSNEEWNTYAERLRIWAIGDIEDIELTSRTVGEGTIPLDRTSLLDDNIHAAPKPFNVEQYRKATNERGAVEFLDQLPWINESLRRLTETRDRNYGQTSPENEQLAHSYLDSLN